MGSCGTVDTQGIKELLTVFFNFNANVVNVSSWNSAETPGEKGKAGFRMF